MNVIEFLNEQIKYYNKLLKKMEKEGKSQNDRDKIQRKIWHCKELQDRYEP